MFSYVNKANQMNPCSESKCTRTQNGHEIPESDVNIEVYS